ncbi:MAG: SDR family NAD(P)-dependent oxidoreductase [Rhodospirillaceae bacterium]|nr:MAG: SDR family NAD(P)-dependent oxidoreductase [Rhodospirillaceae bacterium]
MAHHQFRHILITGASSGIGEALALAYAAAGVTLSLTGRNAARLAAVCDACAKRGAAADGVVLNVADADAVAAWITARDATAPLDLVIANAGISSSTDADSASDGAAQTRRILRVNIDGVVNTVLPTISAMRTRRRGQIAIVSSLAGFRDVGGNPAYGASKAAVRVWGEGLRRVLAADDIGVSVICPGFVRSRITDANRFHMPFFMEAPKAAAIIMAGLAANRGRITFPWPMAALTWFFAALPDRWATVFGKRLPEKT